MWRLPPISAYDRKKVSDRRGERTLFLSMRSGAYLEVSLSQANWMWLVIVRGKVGAPLLKPDFALDWNPKDLRDRVALPSNVRIDEPRPLSSSQHVEVKDRYNQLVGWFVVGDDGHLHTLYWPRNLRDHRLKQIRP